MNIGIDYDDTITRDPNLWLNFISFARKCGHKVYCVTMRYEQEDWGMEEVRSACDFVFFTGRRAKNNFMKSNGINIDVWIDDSPQYVIIDHPSTRCWEHENDG